MSIIIIESSLYFGKHDERRKRLYLLLIAQLPVVHAVDRADLDHAVQLFGQISPLEEITNIKIIVLCQFNSADILNIKLNIKVFCLIKTK